MIDKDHGMAADDQNIIKGITVASVVKGMAYSAPVAAAIFAAITQAEPAVSAWDKVGLPTFATRAWVREDTRTFKNQIIEMQLDLARGKLDQNMIARNQLEISALKFTDDESKVKATQEMRRLDDMIDALRQQIRAMLGARGPQ